MTTFNGNICSKTGYDELVVYAAGLIAEAGQEITFECLVTIGRPPKEVTLSRSTLPA
jgi:hypothetical protein